MIHKFTKARSSFVQVIFSFENRGHHRKMLLICTSAKERKIEIPSTVRASKPVILQTDAQPLSFWAIITQAQDIDLVKVSRGDSTNYSN